MKTQYKQLISVLCTGYILIILMLIFENIGVGSVATIGQENGNSFKEIQAEINKISSNNWDPIGYSTLVAKIHSSKVNGFIKEDEEIDLQKILDLHYVEKVIETAERYLYTSNGDYNKIKKALSQLQKSMTISANDKQKVSVSIKKINAFVYYTSVLPNEISSFINGGLENFDEIICNELVNEIDNLNTLLSPYINNTKIQNVKQNSREALMQFQGESINAGVQF